MVNHQMNLIQLERHHRYYMLQRLKKPIVAILNFYHCFIKFRINELQINKQKYC
jgi:hypothetical protein